MRTDNGGEYIDGAFLTFYRQEGNQRQSTIVDTPQQNGVAERMNKTLLERIRAMLRTAKLPKSFWAEVVKTASYMINQSPSMDIDLKTPMEIWNGKPVDYSSLCVFGCPTYVMYKSQKEHNWIQNSDDAYS